MVARSTGSPKIDAACFAIAKKRSAVAYPFECDLERSVIAAGILHIAFYPGAFKGGQVNRCKPAKIHRARLIAAVVDHFQYTCPGRNGNDRGAVVAINGFDLKNMAERRAADKIGVELEFPAEISCLSLCLFFGTAAA